MKEIHASDFTGVLKDDVERKLFSQLNTKMDPQVYFVLNNRFVCRYDVDKKTMDNETPFFYASENRVEENCKQRSVFGIKMMVYDTVTQKTYPADWNISYDKDIGLHSSVLYFGTTSSKSMFTVTSYEAKEISANELLSKCTK